MHDCRYRHMYQWDNGVMGYLVTGMRDEGSSVCGMMTTREIVPSDCNRVSEDFFCENEETLKESLSNQNDATGKRRDPFSKFSNSSALFTHVACPSGHWTHKFLACDTQTACWHNDDSERSSGSDAISLTTLCQSPLSALFTCRDGVEQVAYSLVCDHSQDCLDASDEDFCVHPSCSGSWQFECNNKQVSSTLMDRREMEIER